MIKNIKDRIKQKLLLDNDTVGLRFYKQPTFLYTNPKYKSLSPEARDLYMQLFNRLSLSKTNNWVDVLDNGQKAYYVVYTLNAMQDIMHCSITKCIEIKHELSDMGLIYEVRTGYKKPNHIYLLDPQIGETDYYDKQPINRLSNSESHSSNDNSTVSENANLDKPNSTSTSSWVSKSENKLDRPFDLLDKKDQKKRFSFNKAFWQNAETIYSSRSNKGLDLSSYTITLLKLVYKTKNKFEKAINLIANAKAHAVKQYFIETNTNQDNEKALTLMPDYQFKFDDIANTRLNSALMRIINKYKHKGIMDINRYMYTTLVNEFREILYVQNAYNA